MSLPVSSLVLGARQSESGDYLEIFTTVNGVDVVLSALKFGYYTQGLAANAQAAAEAQQQAPQPSGDPSGGEQPQGQPPTPVASPPPPVEP